MNPTISRSLKVFLCQEDDVKPMISAMKDYMRTSFGQYGLLATLLFLTGATQTAYAREGVFADASSLKVEIYPAQATVKINQDFSVRTTIRIRNIKMGERLIAIWSCSYPEQWIADNPAVHIEQANCTKNGLETIKLKPGDTLERKLSICVSIPAREIVAKSVTFRLGFRQGTGGLQKKQKPAWSDTVTVKLRE